MTMYPVSFDFRAPSTDPDAFKDELRAQLEATLDARLSRFREVSGLYVRPNTHFNRVAAECMHLYRDGYFFACISLCQAIAEALSRFLAKGSPGKIRGQHEHRVRRLGQAGRISPAAVEGFRRLQLNRDDYHHFNPEVPEAIEALQREARATYEALAAIFAEVFACSFDDGRLVPTFPEYWGPHATANPSSFQRTR
jgi:hypothetical protein